MLIKFLSTLLLVLGIALIVLSNLLFRFYLREHDTTAGVIGMFLDSIILSVFMDYENVFPILLYRVIIGVIISVLILKAIVIGINTLHGE